MNTQPIEKKLKDHKGEELDIVSIFPTIQGEGPYTGERAIFIRLAGCNLQCPGCDTQYTEGRRTETVTNIVYQIREAIEPEELVVITGGEPFRQNISILANTLYALGYKVQVETNGTLPPSPLLHQGVTIVCSPKAGKINPEMKARANCFKYVMHADSVSEHDGLPILALDHSAAPYVARPRLGCPVYLQPMDSQDEEQNKRNIEAVRDSVMKFGYLLQLQIHKIVGVE